MKNKMAGQPHHTSQIMIVIIIKALWSIINKPMEQQWQPGNRPMYRWKFDRWQTDTVDQWEKKRLLTNDIWIFSLIC